MFLFLSLSGDTFFQGSASFSGSVMQSRCASRGNAASKPVLNFPAEFNANRSPNYEHAGATVNGIPSQLFDIVPTNDAQRY